MSNRRNLERARYNKLLEQQQEKRMEEIRAEVRIQEKLKKDKAFWANVRKYQR